jgi:hypothetical protein
VHGQEEVRQGALQGGAGTLEDGEAWSGQLRRAGEVEDAEPFAEVDVVERSEVECGRGSFAADLGCEFLAVPVRAPVFREVRDL